jgi:hypothetical protein
MTASGSLPTRILIIVPTAQTPVSFDITQGRA